MRGKLIVIEGGDGSGKSTQMALLKKYLEAQKHPVKTHKFPDYEAFFGSMIAAYLRGEYGELSQVNPYLISVIYAQDRAQAREQMEQWMKAGNTLLLDRYATSNLAHQCGRLPKSEWEKFLKWDSVLEYTINKIPREDVVLYLHIPYRVSMTLINTLDRSGRAYAKGRKKDIVESDETYLKKSEETYTWLAKKFPHWAMIECIDENGNLCSKQEIHEEVKRALKEKQIIS